MKNHEDFLAVVLGNINNIMKQLKTEDLIFIHLCKNYKVQTVKMCADIFHYNCIATIFYFIVVT